MPIIEFECKECGTRFEDIQFLSDSEDPEECPSCGASKPQKVDISRSSAHFKGGGWARDGYSTDWTKKDSGKFKVSGG